MPKHPFWREGDAIWIYCVLYGAVRFAIESLRTDSLTIGPFPAAYWLSWALILIGVVMFVGRRTIWQGARVVDIERPASGARGVSDRTRMSAEPFVLLVTAHVAMLGKQGLIDDAAVQVISGVVDRVGAGSFEQRRSAMRCCWSSMHESTRNRHRDSPARARLVEASMNWSPRMRVVVLRGRLLSLSAELGQLREDVIDLAIQHVVTIMPAYQQGVAAQPTTLAHLLGGILGPLDRAQDQGSAGLCTGEPVAAWSGRAGFDRTADRSGRSGRERRFRWRHREHFRRCRRGRPPGGSFGIAASSSTADLSLYAGDGDPVPHRSVVADLARRSPQVRSELPQHTVISAFDELATARDRPRRGVGHRRSLDRPCTARTAGGASTCRWNGSSLHSRQPGSSSSGFVTFLNREIAFNRAYLANRANRNHTTVGELADYLMLEEQIPPAQAREMAGAGYGAASG